MFHGWRLQIREADEALKQGRLSEAARLLSEGNLRSYLPGQRLAGQVADAMAEQARRAAAIGDLPAAWRHLDAARQTAGDVDAVQNVEREIVRLAEASAERSLELGNVGAAAESMERLRRRGVADARLRDLEDIARRLQSASHLAERGRMGDAAAQIAAARSHRPDWESLTELEASYRTRADQCAALLDTIHRAMANENWPEAAQAADQLSALAPHHPLAHEVQRRAWAQVGAPQSASREEPREPRNRLKGDRADRSIDRPSTERAGLGVFTAAMPDWDRGAGQSLASSNSTFPAGASGASRGIPNRLVLWVDAVGGYLMCFSPVVTIGQAVPGCHVDIPIQADISRVHAKIRREGEGYSIESIQSLSVNGRDVKGKALLSDGDLVQLGDSVRFRLVKPHPLSASARLEFVSRHRLQPRADGVLLMAESCVLGPNPNSHVVCPAWTGDVVLYRQDDRLYCRALEAMEVDGNLCDGRGELNASSRVVGQDFSLSLEAIG